MKKISFLSILLVAAFILFMNSRTPSSKPVEPAASAAKNPVLSQAPVPEAVISESEILSAAPSTISEPTELLPEPMLPGVPRGNALAAQRLAQKRGAITEPHFARFAEWSERYIQADADVRAALEPEGAVLARARRSAMIDMIQANPERALELAVPFRVRTEMPGAIETLLEERVSGRGTFILSFGYTGEKPLVARHASVNEHMYRAFTFGARADMDSRENIVMNGIAVDDWFALHNDPVRILEPEEAVMAAAALAGDEVCAVSDLPSDEIGEQTIVEVGGEVHSLCRIEHAEELNAQMIEEEEMLTLAGHATLGNKKVLMIRVVFSGESTSEGATPMPLSISAAQTLLANSGTFFRSNSFDRTRLLSHTAGSAITPLFALPQTKSWYNKNGDWVRVVNDAKARAQANGFPTNNYDWYVVTCKSLSGLGASGWASVNNKHPGVLLNGSFGQPLMCHELGHNYGVWHAGAWVPSGSNPIGSGSLSEYGDLRATMGNTSGSLNLHRHFNLRHKNKLWLNPGEYADPTGSGTFRIYAHDNTNSIGGGRLLGIRIVKNSSRNYWVSHRQLYPDNQHVVNGAEIHQSVNPRLSGSGGGSDSLLLDMNPSTSTFSDSALVIGKTFSDTTDNIHITPIAKGTSPINGSTVPWLDVRVNQNVSGNSPPTASWASGTPTSGGVNQNLTFTVNASDPNGDTLAYYWDFSENGGSTYSLDFASANSPSIIKSWSTTGTKAVRVVVSDRKGGTVSITRQVSISTVQAPVITSQPLHRTNNIGDNAQFTVQATGTSLSYQWRRNANNIQGATASELNVAATTANAGTYTVVVSNSGGSVTSNDALLAIPYSNRTKITQWNQNNSPYTGTSTTTPSLGSGSIAMVGDVWSDSLAPRSGSVSDPTSGNNYARSFSGPSGSTANKTAGIRYNVSTIGYTNIVVTWEQNVGDRSSAYWRGQYTTNGTTWIDRGVVDKRTPFVQGNSSYTYHFDNLSGVPGVHNNPNFAYRILAEYQNTATGSGSAAYVPADPNNTYNATGNPLCRFDMVTVLGTPMQLVITQWDHNNSPYTGTATTTPSIGSGSVATVGNVWSDSLAPRTGADSDPTTGDNYARSFSGPSGSTANKTAGIRYNVSTVGYTNIVITWEQNVGDRASAYWRGQYTTNGTTWIDRVVVDKRTPFVQGNTSYTLHSDNLSGVPGVHNNSNFAYRILAEYQNTATGSGSAAYVPADPNNTYNATGNPLCRFDMVTITGILLSGALASVPELEAEPPYVSILMSADTASPEVVLSWDAIPGREYQVQYTTDLSNPDWQVLTDIVAEDGTIVITDSIPVEDPQRFYRLIAR